jgi:hypothetical protein
MQTTPRPGAESAEPAQTVTGICGVRVALVDGKLRRLAPLANHPLGIVCDVQPTE